ncbi:MAG: hypothetical protein NC236_00215 [Mycoplasma sp.]|nr:hypothetical protein [Mycoplasma sp.]
MSFKTGTYYLRTYDSKTFKEFWIIEYKNNFYARAFKDSNWFNELDINNLLFIKDENNHIKMVKTKKIILSEKENNEINKIYINNFTSLFLDNALTKESIERTILIELI